MTLDGHAATTPVQTAPRIADLRSAIEVAGLFFVVGGALMLAGGVMISLKNESLESAGDFLVAVSRFALVAMPFLGLGLLVSAAPRLFVVWESTFRWRLILATAVLGLVGTSAATAASVGATVTLINRSLDDNYAIGAGEWIGQIGYACASIAVMTLSWILLAALGPSSTGASGSDD